MYNSCPPKETKCSASRIFHRFPGIRPHTPTSSEIPQSLTEKKIKEKNRKKYPNTPSPRPHQVANLERRRRGEGARNSLLLLFFGRFSKKVEVDFDWEKSRV